MNTATDSKVINLWNFQIKFTQKILKKKNYTKREIESVVILYFSYYFSFFLQNKSFFVFFSSLLPTENDLKNLNFISLMDHNPSKALCVIKYPPSQSVKQ